MNQSPEIKDLVVALVQVQSVLHAAVKDSINPYFKSKYADLSSVWDAAREPLVQNGLCVIQSTDMVDGRAGVVTILAHISGQWVRGFYPLNPAKEDPQGYGAAVTYARRYALAAMVGVVQADDDGEGAMDRDKKQGNSIVGNGSTADKPGMIYFGYHTRKMPHEVDRDKLELERDRLAGVSGSEAQRAFHVIDEYLKLSEPVPGWDDVHPPAPGIMNNVPHTVLLPLTAGPVNASYGDYEVPFGKKYKGRKVKDISRVEIEGYVKYLEQSAATDGKPLSKDAAELRFAVGRYYGTM